MDNLLDIGIGILRLVPLILLLYVPALFGMVIWSERGEGYRPKAMLWFFVGFGAVAVVQVLSRSVSLAQVAGVIGLSLVQVAIALILARLTVYKLAD